jgi:hypothetical protein
MENIYVLVVMVSGGIRCLNLSMDHCANEMNSITKGNNHLSINYEKECYYIWKSGNKSLSSSTYRYTIRVFNFT